MDSYEFECLRLARCPVCDIFKFPSFCVICQSFNPFRGSITLHCELCVDSQLWRLRQEGILSLKLVWAVELECYHQYLEIYFIFYVYNSVCLDGRVFLTCIYHELCYSERCCTDSGVPNSCSLALRTPLLQPQNFVRWTLGIPIPILMLPVGIYPTEPSP